MKKQRLPQLNKFFEPKRLKQFSSCPDSPASLVKSVFSSSKNLFNSPKSTNPREESSEPRSKTERNLEKITERSKLIRNKALLNEMGFRAEVDFKPINLCENQKDTSKLYSIQVTDFWRKKEKEKFLKDEGYWEAYKEIISDSNKSKLYYSKTFKSPVSPKVLDITTIRKIEKTAENTAITPLTQRQFEIISKSAEVIQAKPNLSNVKSVECVDKLEKLEKLENLQEKCHKLAWDTKKLKSSAEKFRSDISKKFEFRNFSRKKMSRYELSRIRSDIDSIYN